MPWTMILALSVFTYLSGLGLIISCVWSSRLDAHLKMVNPAASVDLEALAAKSPDTRRAFAFLSGHGSSQMLGLNLFALHVLWFPFRHLEPWAWFLMWFYPVMFVWHYVSYTKKTQLSFAQAAYCVMSAGALLLCRTSFWHA